MYDRRADNSYNFKPRDRFSATTIRGPIKATVRVVESGLIHYDLDPEFDKEVYAGLPVSNVTPE